MHEKATQLIYQQLKSMGIYINKGNENFKRALNGEYVDKTGMIEVVNKTLDLRRNKRINTKMKTTNKFLAIILCVVAILMPKSAWADGNFDVATLSNLTFHQSGCLKSLDVEV